MWRCVAVLDINSLPRVSFSAMGVIDSGLEEREKSKAIKHVLSES